MSLRVGVIARSLTRVLYAIAGVCAFGVGEVRAQVDPRGPVRTIATAHFRVHFRADSGAAAEALGQRAATLAEFAYGQLAQILAVPAGPIDLLLADNVDYSNGFAQVFPTNRIVVYAVPPIGAVELRQHDEWLRLVITHELAHIFHLDRARGLWSAARTVFGRNPLLFPNSYTPSWVKEGLAEYYETRLTGSGRLMSPETNAPVRAAALSGQVPPISRWSLASSRYPRGTTAYAYGALMMLQADMAGGGGNAPMRRFVDEVATHPIPFRLNRASRIAFGSSFEKLFDTFEWQMPGWRSQSLQDTTGDSPWRVVANAGMYAESPRWLNADSVIWSASNGRDVAGVYVADAHASTEPRRLARRNALDVNVSMGGDSLLFAQTELRDPYTVRSDLWIRRGTSERRITSGARLTQPDVRKDGAIVAVQLGATRARLVRVYAAGNAHVLSALDEGSNWAEPRWSPDGKRIAAVQLLVSGEQRIVVLDTLGAIREILAGNKFIFASPSFTPDGARLVWASNRHDRMQLETAPIARLDAPIDTTHWRAHRASVRIASNVSTGVYEPSVSPDGKSVVALLLRADGYHVAIASLDTTGAMAAGGEPLGRPTEQPAPTTAASSSYRAARQLLPRYWLPVIGEGRLGHSTYGISSGSVDILGRHAWAADAQINPQLGEWDGAAAYRYAGLGVPVVDLSLSQEWDATFAVVDTKSNPLGTLARRRRFATVSSTFSRPRVRHSVAATFGAQYEWRDFTASVDSLLGAPNALLRRGTRYPQLFVNTSLSTLRRGLLGVSYEEGVTLNTSTAYRWRQDAPSLGSWRSVVTGRAYAPMELPGFSRHVLSLRGAVGVADTRTATEFSVGGVSGVAAELVPGVVVGDPTRTFPVRGVASDAQRGIRAAGASVEYRLPLVLFRSAPSPLTFFADRLSLTVFSDAGRAWCPGAFAAQSASVGLCERPGRRDGWIASAGAELVLDAALQYDVPYRFRFGAAAPYVAPTGVPRKGAFYVSLGSFF